ncbi:MAG TPA: ABC transporter ATP-binding protein [Rhodothermales bacterium]|nr:ABC transporter ATP-binding protein [Rhodothermales bacterium]
MAQLEIRNVTSGYGNGPDILKSVSLTAEAGKAYCIIGPNGAGKSTLLKTLAGLLAPREGEVLFDGQSIAGIRPDLVLRAGVCFVPQEQSLFPGMSVRENLVMGAFLESDRKKVVERIEETLTMFPLLAERSNQAAGTMSGGEQQLLALARALMIRPRLMMIDEPSLGLAPQAADQVFGVIASLKAMGITLLLVEQNVMRGLACSDFAFLLDLGTLRLEDSADRILDDPSIRELYLGRHVKAPPTAAVDSADS